MYIYCINVIDPTRTISGDPRSLSRSDVAHRYLIVDKFFTQHPCPRRRWMEQVAIIAYEKSGDSLTKYYEWDP
jgi:hypothetical protein